MAAGKGRNVFGIRRRIQGGRLWVNDEKREEQGLKERKASPIREHERISVFSFLGFQKRGAADLGSPVASARKKEAHFSVFRELGSCAMPCGGGMAGSFQGRKGKDGVEGDRCGA